MFLRKLIQDLFEGNKRAFIFLISFSFLLGIFLSTFVIIFNNPIVPSAQYHPPTDTILKGRYAIAISRAMTIYENNIVMLKITATHDSTFSKTLDTSKFHIKDSVQILTPVINAKLVDPTNENFRITTAGSTEKQFLTYYGNTSWEWNVKPLETGSKNLKIILTLNIPLKDKEINKDTVIFNEPIRIISSPPKIASHFLIQNWQLLLNAILIPLVIWTFKKYNDDKKSRNSKPKPIGFRPDGGRQ